MKAVTNKLKHKGRKSSLLVHESVNNKAANSNTQSVMTSNINMSNDDRRIPSKSLNKKLRHVRKSTQPLGSSLLECDAMDTSDEENDESLYHHEPEIFIDTRMKSAIDSGDTQSYELAMLQLSNKQKIESISHKQADLEEFLDVWNDTWSDHQILSYFSKYLSDPRVIALDIAFNQLDDIRIPKEIWQTIVSFEFGSAKKQIKRRYYHWIAHQRKEIYWIPFILGSMQCFGVFFVLFYVFVSGTSLNAADIGTADITDQSGDEDTPNVHYYDIRFYCAMMTVIAAVLQIIGALRSYYWARFRYSHKLKRFKRIIHLIKSNSEDTPKLQSDHSDDDDQTDEVDEDEKDSDDDDDKYMKVRDLPNVEINFDIHQVPPEFRHIFLQKAAEEKNRYRVDTDSDSGGDEEEEDMKEEMDPAPFMSEEKRAKRLDYMMGIIAMKDDMILEEEEYAAESLEEMQLILCGWESYIAFQRWINITSLVVTDNLGDPYLISFVLHKYLYVLCISTYVFGQKLTTFESLIPFILLFVSFSYLGLIVLDRISAKRAILYILSMVGCCGIIIGIFTGILFLLSFLFYEDSSSPSYDNNTGYIANQTTTAPPAAAWNSTTYINQTAAAMSPTEETLSEQQTWWITDFFYPILAFILCSNTIRRIRNGFDNNIPEIKYTLWSNCCFVALIMTFATNSATWSNAEVKAVFLAMFVYMGYLWAQMRLHQAVTRLKKIDYANKYLRDSKWVKTQLLWSWLGQLSKKF
eukprot:48942_1